MACTAVLTYHSHNISGASYATNDHVALASDLAMLHEMGAEVVPLSEIAERVRRGVVESDLATVAISFDDGPLFDFADFEHPRFGPQRGFLNILRDFRAQQGASALPRLHATSFVIASPDARRAMETSEDCGYTFLDEWLGDGWWREAETSGLLEIGNHSWDHVHHAFEGVVIGEERRDNFTLVDNAADAEKEISAASDYIAERIGRRPRFFAYPFGHSNDYLVREYLPRRGPALGLEAAFGTDGVVTESCDVWSIPRVVCAHDWRTPAELRSLLSA
jgi:peptidoglycan/xylan/chitin deacetylase (PgdA/CDA1 family)